MNALARWVLGLAAGTLLVLVWAAPAWSHATLVSSSPEEGERLDALPGEVALEFSEEMSPPAFVVVTAPDGSSVTAGDPQVEGATVRQDLTAAGSDGTYTVAFRVVSADGHPITGQITFAVGDPASSAGADSTSRATPDTSAVPAVEPSATDASVGSDDGAGLWAEHGLTVVVPGALFLAAAGLYLLSRRTSP